MDDLHLPAAPAWVRWTVPIVRRLPAGRYRMINRLCRRPPGAFRARLAAELGGAVFRCDLRDGIAREVCFTGRYEPQETALVRAVLRPGMTFVDVGANWGYFTLLGCHLAGPTGRVLSLEPDPRLFEALQSNLRANGYGHAVALPVAAAAERGRLALAGFDEAGGNFGLSRIVSRSQQDLEPDSGLTGRLFTVAAEPLDAVLDGHGVGTVHLLKMDIEGAEAFALAGLRDGLAGGRVQRLLLELHPAQLAEHGESAAAVIELLLGHGYRGWRIDHSAGSNRRAAYRRRIDLHALLRPLEPGAALGPWPHTFWTLAGLEPSW